MVHIRNRFNGTKFLIEIIYGVYNFNQLDRKLNLRLIIIYSISKLSLFKKKKKKEKTLSYFMKYYLQ